MKCVDCDLKKLQECKCGGNRYYCGHPDAPRQNGAGSDLQDRAAFYGADD